MVILPSIRRKYMVSRIPWGATVPMSDCVVTLASDSTSYTGAARTVGVTVTWQGATLTVNTDYTLSYANNVNLGPATVTVTGMGQFSGSVTKTFYIVSASTMPWDFMIEDAEIVGQVSISTNNGRVLPLMDSYQNGYGLLPVAYFINGQWLRGYTVPRDGNGEFHASAVSISESTCVSTDGTGAGDSCYMALAVSPDGTKTFWGLSGHSKLRQKTGPAFSFSEMTDAGQAPSGPDNPGYYGMFFANGGRYIFVPGSGWKVYRFTLSSPYDITTLDAESVSEQKVWPASSNYMAIGLTFGNDGMSALVSMNNKKIYQLSLVTPYDFTGGTVASTLDLSARTDITTSFHSLCILNEGRTLFAGHPTGIVEFSLPASE